MFATGTSKFKQVLKQCDELIFAFAVGQKQREEDREVAGTDEDFFSDLLRKVFGRNGILCQVMER